MKNPTKEDFERAIAESSWLNCEGLGQNIPHEDACHFREINSRIASERVFELAKQMQPKWIPVSERLPDEGIEVFIAIQWGDIPIQAFLRKGIWIGSSEVRQCMIDGFVNDSELEKDTKVTHWQPLPEPPKPTLREQF